MEGKSARYIKVLSRFVYLAFNNKLIYFTHEYISQKCGISLAHVKRILDQLREDGFIASFYIHKNSCKYRLAPSFFLTKIRKSLSSIFPILACILTFGFINARPYYSKNELQYKETCITSNLSNKRTVSSSKKRKTFRKTLIPGEVSGETPKPMPVPTPWDPCQLAKRCKEEIYWAKEPFYNEDYQEWKFEQVNPVPFALTFEEVKEQCLQEETEKIECWLEQELQRIKATYSRVDKSDSLSITRQDQGNSIMSTTASEQREKLREVAMNKLVPEAARRFKKLCLTIAGKIRLAEFPTEAIEFAESVFDTKLTGQRAFDDVVRIAQDFCRNRYRTLTPETVEVLCSLYEIHPEQASVKEIPSTGRVITKPEHIPYVHKVVVNPHVPAYKEHFMTREASKKTGYPAPEKYKIEYDKYLHEECAATGVEPAVLDKLLFEMYQNQKGTDEVHHSRKTNSSPTSTVFNSPRPTRL